MLSQNHTCIHLDEASPINHHINSLSKEACVCVFVDMQVFDPMCLWAVQACSDCLFCRERQDSREASAAEQLLKTEQNCGQALIYNVNMLLESELQWKRRESD